MAIVSPTITESTLEGYNARIASLEQFAPRIHIDLGDGEFSPVTLIDLDKVWWPENLQADIHVMYQRPLEHLETMIRLKPHLIVVPAEVGLDLAQFAKKMHEHGILAGAALLHDSPVSLVAPFVAELDHVLIFSGKLGHHGGVADLALLGKVRELKALKPELEIGWDGGVDDKVAKALADGGVDELNTGGFIAHAEDPKTAFEALQTLISPSA
jgi:ribulose-phosphate 3-epimerase